jgi:hypothetical protein
MTAQKPFGRLKMVVSQTEGVSLGDPLTDRSMSYWLEKISPEDIARLWKQLKENAKAAQPRTTWVQWVNGTISNLALRVDVTTCTTRNGFVLVFTGNTTSTSNGAEQP